MPNMPQRWDEIVRDVKAMYDIRVRRWRRTMTG